MDDEKDDDEIDLDDDDDDNDDEADSQDNNKQGDVMAGDVAEEEPAAAAHGSEQDAAAHDSKQPPPVEQPEAAVAMSQAAAMKQRLRQLKQKMNQARHLNQQAVKQEGERMGSHEALNKEKRRLRAMDKQGAAAHLCATNSKAWQLATEHDIAPKFLLQQASESMHMAQKRMESQERNQYSVNDTYNPEGQHRNYENSLKQLPTRGKQQSQSLQRSTDRLAETFDPLQHQVAVTAAASGGFRGVHGTDRPFLSAQQERQGARRLAQEMQARLERNQKKEAEKKRKLERQEEAQHEDVGYINARNKRFNQKINRTYGKDTAEIKQNLERGTAL
jgi:pre-mRNA-splicing factor SYF2